MNELIMKYLGKECLINTMNSQVDGIIRSVSDNWLEVEKDGKTNAVNLDYIIRIQEYPRNKKGKKKSIVLD